MKKTKVVDKRVEHTKSRLSQALLALIAEKGYDSVSIQDIIDRAGVGKSTFYSHFENKHQLLLAGKISLLQIVEGNSGNDVIDFHYFYRHAAAHFQFSKGLLNSQGWELIEDHMHELFRQKLLLQLGDKITEPDRILVSAAASAIVQLLYDWLHKEMPIRPNEMANLTQSMVTAIMNEIKSVRPLYIVGGTVTARK